MDPRVDRQVKTDVYVAERLYFRLWHLAEAYQLPLLGRLPRTATFSFPCEQFPGLSDEISFLLDVVNDPLLANAVAPLGELLQPRGLSGYGWRLDVEAP